MAFPRQGTPVKALCGEPRSSAGGQGEGWARCQAGLDWASSCASGHYWMNNLCLWAWRFLPADGLGQRNSDAGTRPQPRTPLLAVSRALVAEDGETHIVCQIGKGQLKLTAAFQFSGGEMCTPCAILHVCLGVHARV